jgi:hypothetical protein
MSKPITISIVGNAGPLKKSLNEADDAMAKFGGSIKKLGLAAAAGVGTLAAGIGFAAKAAAEDQKSFEQMAITLRNVTGATDEMTKAIDEQLGAMSLATGVADDKLRPAFEALARGTKNTELAMQQMNLVLDISTALQMDQTTVADALAKAQQGNMKALQALAPELKTLIKDGLDAEGAMSVLADTFAGSATAAAETFSGRMARLQVAFSEIVEQIGYAVLPMLEKIATFIADRVVPVVQALADAFSEDGLRGVLRLATDGMLSFYDEASTTTKAVIAGTIALGGMYAAFKALTFIQTVTGLVQALTVAVNQATVSMGAFQTTALGMAKVVGLVFASVAISVDQLLADNAFAAKGLLRAVADFTNVIIAGIEATFNSAVYATNLLIKAMNAIPGVEIDELAPVRFGRIPLPFDPGVGTAGKKLPTLVIPSIENMGGAPAIAAPAIPALTPDEEDGGGGRGGGGRDGGRATAASDNTVGGQFLFSNAEAENIIGGQFLFSNAEAEAQFSSPINITVNTVSADANLPNLIVDALQQYNLIAGPIDVQIAL